jgi:hypothetical protein
LRAGRVAVLLAATASWPGFAAQAQDASPPAGWQAPVEAVGSTTLSAPILDLAMATATVGYATLASGDIVRFELPDAIDAPISTTVVHAGLVNPRGVAALDGTLYVVELGAFPCEGAALCEGPILDAEHPADGEVTILRATRGRIVAFDLHADGSLGPARDVLVDLPVVNAYHAVDGLTAGPDGALYVSVGNVDRLWYQPDRALETTPHPEWLGTVLRVGPPGTTPTIVASGLRNTYEITFDGTGRMWAIDNDGPTTNGYRMEEVLQLREGHDYGYPNAGTFLGDRARDDGPVWLSATQGTGGLAWAGDAGLTPGLLIGDCSSLTYLRPQPGRGTDADWERSLNPGDQVVLGSVPACLTSIVPLGDGEILVGGQGRDGKGPLYRIRFTTDAGAG